MTGYSSLCCTERPHCLPTLNVTPGSLRCPQNTPLETLASRACPILRVFLTLPLWSYFLILLLDLILPYPISEYWHSSGPLHECPMICSGHLFYTRSSSYSFPTYAWNESRCCQGHTEQAMPMSCDRFLTQVCSVKTGHPLGQVSSTRRRQAGPSRVVETSGTPRKKHPFPGEFNSQNTKLELLLAYWHCVWRAR